jgi:hypothetical protein
MTGDVYEVPFRGSVPAEQVAASCADLQLQADVVIHGVVRDQAVVHGLLDRLRELGFQLVDAHKGGGDSDRQPAIDQPDLEELP